MFRHKTARQFLRALQSATDSTKIAHGRYSILQRLRSLTSPSSAPPILTSSPPESSTYFDHLSKIAAGKRSQRASVDSTAPQEISRHCLHCGYNRRGLAASQPCPECGHIDEFEQHQQACLKFTNHPRKLFWRLLTFRAPPAGWWEAFDQPSLHRFSRLRAALLIFIAALLTAAACAAGNLIANDLQIHRTATAWLYRSGDPEKKKVQEYGHGTETVGFWDRNRTPRGSLLKFSHNPVPGLVSQVDWQEKLIIRQLNPYEYILYPAGIIAFILCGWLIYRHGWLNVTLMTTPDLVAADRQAATRAMAPLALIYFALPIAMLLLLSLIIALSTLVPFPPWTFNVIAGVMVLYPPLLLFRSLKADISGRIFPNRALAALFLAAAALLNAVVLAIAMGLAALLLRLLGHS